MLFCRLWNIFFKINFSKIISQEYHQSVKQFGSRSDPTFCRAWSGSKLFAKVISRWHELPLAEKELNNVERDVKCKTIIITCLHEKIHAENKVDTPLTLSTLGKIFSRWHFEIFFLFFPEHRIWRFMQIVSSGDNSHEMSSPVFWKK